MHAARRRLVVGVVLTCLALTACRPAEPPTAPSENACPSGASATWQAMSATGAPTFPAGARVVTSWDGQRAGFAATAFGGVPVVGLFDPCLGTWTAASHAGLPRAIARVAWIDGAVVAWDVSPSPRAWVYRTADARWHGLDGDLLPSRSLAGPNGRMVVWGEDALHHVDYGQATLVDVSRATAAPVASSRAPSPRVMASAAAIADGWLVFGGRTRTASQPLGDGARLTGSPLSWQPLPSLDAPSPRFGAVVVVHGEDAVIWGGRDPEPLADGAYFDGAHNRWSAIQSDGGPDAGAGATALTATHFVVVDEDAGYVFDLARGSWLSFDTPVPMSRAVRAARLSNGDVLFIDPAGRWFWRLSPATAQWSNIAPPRGAAGRVGAAVVVTDDHLLLWGGRSTEVSCVEATPGTDAAHGPARCGTTLNDGVMRRL